LHEQDGLLVSDQFNLARLDKTIRLLRVDLSAAGYDSAIQDQLAGIEEIKDAILAESGKLNLPEEFSAESESMLSMLAQGAEEELLTVANAAAGAVAQALRRAAVGGLKLTDLILSIAATLDIYEGQAKTLVTTTLHSLHSSVRVKHFTDAGVEWFLYAGPDDDVTREWCSHFVGTRVTPAILEEHASEWGREGKTPLRPVTSWRGGWNCRHELIPLLGKGGYREGPGK